MLLKLYILIMANIIIPHHFMSIKVVCQRHLADDWMLSDHHPVPSQSLAS